MADEHGQSAVDDLDELLDSVLDDFQKVERGNSASSSIGTAPSTTASGGLSKGYLSSKGATVGQGLGLNLPPLKKKASSQTGNDPESSAPKAPTAGTSKLSAPSSQSLGATLEKLRAETRQTVENIDSSHEDDAMGDELVDNLVKQFEDLGGSQDMQTIMDTMMRQLLSKEVLHEPMKEIGERYPEWLAANKARLSEEDFARYARQHQHIKDLCVIYENTPDDFQKIVDLMQKMQDCGQPPSDIIRELAPGLELGDDGLPMLPDLSGVGGPGGLGNNCSIM